MDITDRGSRLLLGALEINHCTAVRLTLQDVGCCNKPLDIELVDVSDEMPAMFNRVPVIMDAQTKWSTAGCLIDEQDGELVIRRQESCGCSCGRSGY